MEKITDVLIPCKLQWHIIQNYTVLHSLCTLLFVIGQGIISITQSSCRFSRFHKNNYYNVANPYKKSVLLLMLK